MTPDAFGGITSVTTMDAPSLPADQSKFPTSMKNAQFCVLKDTLGYPELYVGTSGACIEGILSCSASGILKIHSLAGCTGPAQTYSLTATPSSNADPTLNTTFVAEFRQITATPAKSITWTELMPAALLVLENRTAFEIAATICYIIISILEVGLLGYFSYRYFKMRTFGGLLLMICHLFYVIYIGLVMNYNYQKFSSKTQLLDSLTSWGFFYALATLMTAVCTTNFIVIFWRLSKEWTYGLYLATFVVHFGLTGDRYLYAGLYRTALPTKFDEAITYWSSKVSFIWIIVLIIYDLVPICIVVARASIANPGTAWQKFKTAMEIDFIAAIMFYTQFLVVIGYSVNEYIRQSTPILLNDRSYLASKAFSICLLVVHSLLNTVIIFRIARSVQEGKFGPSSTAKSWKSSTKSSKVDTKVDDEED